MGEAFLLKDSENTKLPGNIVTLPASPRPIELFNGMAKRDICIG